ncbi:hypothetical protein SAMN06295912_102136 [Sphingomonas laterariae]|uniref:Uncharacterized protein n=1 Tax=Edaphosphingomonas laterariae TaxID=861865 RepID=A0A239CCM2_9SPHN|nr:hypothetical protein [Sphingomonas laterariae]SNS17986.1 hypothetical protein SAMN06295912_102136 [Sphingomonas laterariae]
MPAFDIWAVAAALTLMALVATLRLSLPGAAGGGQGTLRLIAHPAWLVLLVLTTPMTVGLMLSGYVPVSPTKARALIAGDFGYWAGVAAWITVVTAELWLLWTPSMVAQRFAKPEARDAFRALPLFNVFMGGGFLLLVWWAGSQG